MANYESLFNCLAAYPGGHAAAEADPQAAADWANEEQSILAEEIPTTAVWRTIMKHRDADWQAPSGTTSGGETITDQDRDDVRHSVIGGGRQSIEVSPGSWGRTLLLDVFGGSSDTITDLAAQFTSQVRRCSGFGGEVEAADILEAIRRFGD